MSDFGCGVWVVGLWCGVLWDCGVGCEIVVKGVWCLLFEWRGMSGERGWKRTKGEGSNLTLHPSNVTYSVLNGLVITLKVLSFQ